MARFQAKSNPFGSATTVLMPDIAGYNPDYSAAESSGIMTYTRENITSATSSYTILSLEGPGLVNFLEWDNKQTDPAYSLSISIDDRQCLSLTFTASTSKTVALIGFRGFYAPGEQGQQSRGFDPVVFNKKFLLTIKSASPVNTLTSYRAHWRLTK